MSSNWTDERLEATLETLREEVVYPPTPPLATNVRRHLALGGGTSRRWDAWRPRPWQAAAALLIVCLMAALVIPQTRAAVADRLGLRGVRITQGPESERVPPISDPRLLLGTRVDLDTARSSVRFPILAPTLDEIGAPDEVYLNRTGSGAEVSLIYGPRTGLPLWGSDLSLLISQAEGRQVGPLFEKGVGTGTQVRYVKIGEDVGIWIDGAPHRFQYLAPGGVGQVGEARLAANALVWEHGDRIIRVEGAMSEDVAVRIAMSLR